MYLEAILLAGGQLAASGKGEEWGYAAPGNREHDVSACCLRPSPTSSVDSQYTRVQTPRWMSLPAGYPQDLVHVARLFRLL